VDLPNRTRVWSNLAQKIRLCEIVIKKMRDSARFVKFAFVQIIYALNKTSSRICLQLSDKTDKRERVQRSVACVMLRFSRGLPLVWMTQLAKQAKNIANTLTQRSSLHENYGLLFV